MPWITLRKERLQFILEFRFYSGSRTGRAQFGFICYVPQAKLKVMGGVKVRIKLKVMVGEEMGWNVLGGLGSEQGNLKASGSCRSAPTRATSLSEQRRR